MKKSNEKTMKDFESDFCIENYTSTTNDIAVTSEITKMKVSASTLTFDYTMPKDNVHSKEVIIWKDITIDKSKPPVYRSQLSSNKGQVTVKVDNLNFLKGTYTIAVTASNELSTVAATQSILAGNIITQGSSSLVVIGCSLDYISTVFNSPPNVLAKDNWTFLLLRKGPVIGQGPLLAKETNPSNERSGLARVDFNPGTLIDGEVYNVVFNPGSTYSTFTAGYAFTYILQ